MTHSFHFVMVPSVGSDNPNDVVENDRFGFSHEKNNRSRTD